MKNEHGLTVAEEKFAAAIASGAKQSEAYRQVYPRRSRDWTAASVWNKASVLAKRPEVKARIAALLAKSAAESEVTVERITREAASIAFAERVALMRWGPGALGTKVRAIELLARIAGAFKEDNKQMGDALGRLLAGLPGNVIGANKVAALDAGDAGDGGDTSTGE